MLKGIDFGAIAMKAAGNGAGAVAAGKLASLPIIQKIANPTLRGLAIAGIGYVVPGMLKKKTSGKKADIIQHVGDGIGTIGIYLAARAAMPGVVPAIAGYEENPVQGLGEMYDNVSGDDDGMSGYEENPINGADDGVYGDASGGDMDAA